MRNTDTVHGNERRSEEDALDLALDAALRKYAAVEPRTGLEQRVLAQLESDSVRLRNRSWWRWTTAGAIAALLVIVAALAWRSNKPMVAQHPSAPVEGRHSSSAQIVTNKQTNALSPFAVRQTKAPRRHIHETSVAADAPKLDQFPSPRPLSEQERLALEYVERFPEQASLMAQAQSNFAQQLATEEKQWQTNSQ
jgi:hypothetical protein